MNRAEHLIAPSSDSGFISVIGGRGYGESICIHLGENKWGVIDSFKLNGTKKSAPLEYLKEIGQNPIDVEFIVISHFHSDHTGGMINLVKECLNAKVYISLALDSEVFLNLIKNLKKVYNPQNSLHELKLVKRYLEKNGRTFEFLKDDSPIYRGFLPNGSLVNITALSPNSQTISHFLNSIGKASTGLKLALKREDPNYTSIATLVSYGDTNILLSSDLEIHPKTNKMGLEAIRSTFSFSEKVCKVFKIPHHGSENGYSNSLWSELTDDSNVYLIGTPFNRLPHDKKLPTKILTTKIIDFSDSAFITSDPRIEFKNKVQDLETKKLMRKLMLKAIPLIKDIGIVQVKIKKGKVKVVLFGNAIPFSKLT